MVVEKDDIRFVFNEFIMQPGDVLLMNTYESQRRLMPGCKYDHAAIYLGDAYLIEADGLGVFMNHVYSYAFKESDHGCVLRLKNGSQRVIDNALHWVKGQMAMEFGAHQARMVEHNKNSEVHEKSNRTFCSRLVAQAFHEGGVDLVHNPDFCAPDDFLASEYLEVVEPSLQPFTEEMSMTVMNGQEQRNKPDWNMCLAEMFMSMGDFYKEDIQTIDQLFVAAVHHTDVDETAIELLMQQKWMTHPVEQTKQIWPWFGDDDSFFAHFPSTEDVMFFLRNQILHYDKTYLPIFRENALNVWIFSRLRMDSKVVKVLSEHFDAILKEAISVRKRLADLYIEAFVRDEEGFLNFCKKYGHERSFEYKEGQIDITRTVVALLEHGPANIVELLKDDNVREQ